MVDLISLLTLVQSKKILVIGDLMLDSYTIGKASRISPEAPVAVLHVKEERSLPGGAGNVALNLLSLDQKVSILGRCGDDAAGFSLKSILQKEGAEVATIFSENNYPTPVKNRIIADNQQMLRIDHESTVALSKELESQIIAVLPELFKGIDLIAISDYGKGFLSRSLLQAIFAEASKAHIRVVVDPKGADFTKYKGAFLIKPNLKEAYLASHMPQETPLAEVASKLLKESDSKYLMITRSEAGLSIFTQGIHQGIQQDFPVKVKEVKDVTGAGDTVLATLASALASDLTLDQTAKLANVAASIAVEHVGCARITLTDISHRLLEEHREHKLISNKQAPILHYALKSKQHTIIELTDETMLDQKLFDKIQTLKVTPEHILVMSLSAQFQSPHLIPILVSLREVDFVINHE